MLKKSRNGPKEQKAERAIDFLSIENSPCIKCFASNVLIQSAEVFIAKLILREQVCPEMFKPHRRT